MNFTVFPVSVLRKLLRYDPTTGMITHRRNGKAALASVHSQGYRYGDVAGVRMYAHRAAWAMSYGAWPERQIDHINGDTADNRLSNLRQAGSAENNRNRRRPVTNRSGVIGVCWHVKRQKWRAKITVAGKIIHLGAFDDFGEAVAARAKAEAENDFHPNHGRH